MKFQILPGSVHGVAISAQAVGLEHRQALKVGEIVAVMPVGNDYVLRQQRQRVADPQGRAAVETAMSPRQLGRVEQHVAPQNDRRSPLSPIVPKLPHVVGEELRR